MFVFIRSEHQVILHFSGSPHKSNVLSMPLALQTTGEGITYQDLSRDSSSNRLNCLMLVLFHGLLHAQHQTADGHSMQLVQVNVQQLKGKMRA